MPYTDERPRRQWKKGRVNNNWHLQHRISIDATPLFKIWVFGHLIIGRVNWWVMEYYRCSVTGIFLCRLSIGH